MRFGGSEGGGGLCRLDLMFFGGLEVQSHDEGGKEDKGRKQITKKMII